MQTKTILMKIKTFFTKKRIIWAVSILVVLFFGWLIFGKKSNANGILTDVVKRQDIEKTVLTTGQVVSSIDLDLSLQAGGIVRKVLVKEGDIVHTGQVLVELDTTDLVAQLHSAQAGLAISKQQASTTKSDLSSVTAQQNLLVKNAYSNLLNSALSAQTVSNYSGYDAPTVSGTYTCGKEGFYDLKTYSSTGGISVAYTGLEQGSFLLTDVPRPMGNCGLFLSFDKTKSLQSGIEFNVDIPNKNAPDYNLNNNAYQLALQTRDKAIADAQANISTTDSSLSVADAQIAQAQANVEIAQAKLQDAQVVAPTNGTITQVDIKIGELAQPAKEVMKLLNVGELHTEALVSEADIASVAIGQPIDNTFDALGPDVHFTTKVLAVNPASTIISGVVNYKVTGSLEKIPDIKPGMTANMTIRVAEKKNVLVVPGSAIINKNGEHIVRVVNDPIKKTYTEVPVQTGLEADGGLTEITSGLNEGEGIVTYIK